MINLSAAHGLRRRAFLRSVKRSEPSRRRRLQFEPLEVRRVLAVGFSTVGTTVNITGDGAPDNVTLEVNAAGHIAFKANGGPFVDTGLPVTAPQGNVNVNLGDGDDSLLVDHGGPGGFVGGNVSYDGGRGNH